MSGTATELTPQQQAFLSRHLRKGMFTKSKNTATTKAYLEYNQVEQEFKTLAAEIPKEDPQMINLVERLRTTLDAKNAGRFEEATQSMAALVLEAQQIKPRLAKAKIDMLREATAFSDTSWLPSDVAQTALVEQQKIATALTAPLPKPDEFNQARVAIDTLRQLYGEATKSVKQRRQTLLATPLADPPFAATVVLGVLQGEREKRAQALAQELPTPQQFAEAEQAIDAFGKAVEAEKIRVKQARTNLLGRTVSDPPFAGTEALAALKVEREKATTALKDELPTPQQFETAQQAIDAFEKAATAEKKRVTDRRNVLRAELAKFKDPRGLTDTTWLNMLKAEREKATTALNDEAPVPGDIKKAEKAIGELDRLIKLVGLSRTNPDAARKALNAFVGFDRIVGDTEPTPELIEEAGKQREAATTNRKQLQQTLAERLADYKKAEALPEGTPKETRAKQNALQQTAQAWRQVKRQVDSAVSTEQNSLARENALVGKKSLTAALRHGPLSPESPRPFKPETAEKLIAAYSKDGRMADAALRAASTAKFPDALADGLDAMIGRVGDGFVDGTGVGFSNQEYSRHYAEQLLKMGGETGDAFFARLPDYVASGRQFEATEFEHNDAKTFNVLAQKRSVSLAGKLTKPDGTLDLDSDDAKNAVGDMLFHPKVLRNATPAMNAQMLKTLEMLSDPVTGPQAEGVLKGIQPPTNPGAQTLLRGALGKEDTDTIGAEQARTGVLASMLKPLDQGPVGSCFATAPARRMREQQPVEAMKAFAEIASKGTYKPVNGPEVPIVTNTPPGEDPLMRSWEYSLATSAARNAGSRERDEFVANVTPGLEQLKTLAVGKTAKKDRDSAWSQKKKKLIQDVASAFTFTYDPLSEVTDANDGSSSQGRYVIVPTSGGAPITERDAFVQAISQAAISSLGLDPTSEDATKVRDLVKTDSFVNAVCPGKYKPWELGSGGYGDTACKALFGPSQTKSGMLGGASKTTPPSEGERTKQVLGAFMSAFGSSSDEMVTIETTGMHSFNALPQHPSLAPLKAGGSSKFARNLQDKLVTPGTQLKDTELSADRAAFMFDQEVERTLDGQSDNDLKTLIRTGAKAKRPSGPMKPAALARALKEAMEAYHDAVADKRAKSWEEEEKKKPGRTVDPTEVTKKKGELKDAFDKNAENSAKSMMIRAMGAPEFVIADTNWGDSRSHTFFVVAPDPTTGEPTLWKKEDPPGSLTPAGRDWVDAPWVRIQ